MSPEDLCDVLLINRKTIRRLRHIIQSQETVENLAELFQALSDPTRLKIVMILNEQELCVCDLSATIGMTNSAISHHLRLLRNLKLVKCRRKGKLTLYSLDDEHIQTLIQQAQDHVEE